MTDPELAKPPARRQWPFAVAAAVVLVVLAVRQARFVAAYAVDVLWYDSWDLYDPLFHGQGWWATFDQQHGPHRQGFGGLLMRAMAKSTRWDCRCDAAAVSGSLIAAAGLGLWLAWRCGVRSWPLLAVPVVYLNARQYTMLIASANPSHGALPVLLLTATGLAWFVRRVPLRMGLLVVLTFAMIFTGFGLFGGLLTPPLLYLEMRSAARSNDRRRTRAAAVALAGTALAWAAFAHGYRPDASSELFRFPVDRPREYVWFVAVLLSNAVGHAVGAFPTRPDGPTLVVGLGTAVAGAVVCVAAGRRVLRSGVSRDPATVAIFTLAAFGLLFAVQVAVGRTPEGWQTASAPRYVTLCIPAMLAVLLELGRSHRPLARATAVTLGVLLAIGTATLRPDDLASAAGLRDGCLRWRAAYLATGSETEAVRRSGFILYPKGELAARLAYLRRGGLNLFDPAAFPTPPGTGGR